MLHLEKYNEFYAVDYITASVGMNLFVSQSRAEAEAKKAEFEGMTERELDAYLRGLDMAA